MECVNTFIVKIKGSYENTDKNIQDGKLTRELTTSDGI